MNKKWAVLLVLFLGASAGAADPQTSAEAERAAREATAAAQRSEQCMADQAARNTKVMEKGRAALAEARALVKEKKASIDELSQGLYCSKCNRTATEIEKGGEGFQSHLGRVQGRAIPASAKRIKAKADEYDRKIENARATVDRYVKENEDLRAKHRECRTEREASRLLAAQLSARANLLKAQEQAAAQEEERRRKEEARVAELKARAETYRKYVDEFLSRLAREHDARLSRSLPPMELLQARIDARRQVEATRRGAIAQVQRGVNEQFDPKEQAEKDMALLMARLRASASSAELQRRAFQTNLPDVVGAPSDEDLRRQTQAIGQTLLGKLPPVPSFGVPSWQSVKDQVARSKGASLLRSLKRAVTTPWEDEARGTMGTSTFNDMHGRINTALWVNGGPIGDFFKNGILTDNPIWIVRSTNDIFETSERELGIKP